MRGWIVATALAVMVSGCAGPAASTEPDVFAGDVEQRIEEGMVPLANGTGAITGVVRNVNGVPLSDAHVLVIGSPASGRTQADGAFLLTDVIPGTQRLRVDRAGYLGLERDIEVAAGKLTRLNVTLADNTPGGPGFREHLHDLWRGAPQMTLLDSVVRHQHEYAPSGGALAPCTRGAGTVSTTYCYNIPLALEPGTLVAPGTAQLDFVVDWENTDFVSHVNIHYQPANETAFRISPPMAPGDVFSANVRYPMTDHGHQTFTQWRFVLWAEPKAGGLSLSSQHVNEHTAGDFAVKIVAIKGELPPEDPHPRYWAAGDSLVLMEEARVIQGLPRTRIPTATVCTASSICFLLPEGTVVPPGTTRLLVTLEYHAGTPAAEAFMTQKTLSFRTAARPPSEATLEKMRVEAPIEMEMGRTVYELPLGEGEADPFYQARSNWLFLLANEGEERGEQFIEDCYHYVAGCGGSTYQLQVVAVNDDWTPELAGVE